MQSDRDKEQTRTVGVGMAEDVAGVDLAQNVFNGHSGTNHVRRVVHRKNDAGHDLNVQTDAAKATEFPKDVQVTRGWIVVRAGCFKRVRAYRMGCARSIKQGDSSTHGLNRDGVVRAGTTNEEFYGYSTQDQHRLGDWWELDRPGSRVPRLSPGWT